MTDNVTQDIVAKLKAQTEEFNRQRKELVEGLRVNFQALFSDTFENYPEISHFRWEQYTPYFNDGDSCEFSRHEINAFTAEDDGKYWEDSEGLIPDGDKIAAWKHYLENGTLPADFYSHLTEEAAQRQGKTRDEYLLGNSWIIPASVKELTLETIGREAEVAMAASNMIKALNDIPEDIFEDLFGDHVRVIVTRAGVEVEDYDHD